MYDYVRIAWGIGRTALELAAQMGDVPYMEVPLTHITQLGIRHLKKDANAGTKHL